jgi:hypothetical protein
MPRKKHPDKNIEASVVYAEERGWIYKESGNSSHAWGRLLCPLHTREGHQMSIWTTPRNTYNHAEQIKKLVDRCAHREEKNWNDIH